MRAAADEPDHDQERGKERLTSAPRRLPGPPDPPAAPLGRQYLFGVSTAVPSISRYAINGDRRNSLARHSPWKVVASPFGIVVI